MIRACLQKDPRQRIAHFQDLRLAIDGAFDATASDARSEPRWPPWQWLIAVAVIAVNFRRGSRLAGRATVADT